MPRALRLTLLWLGTTVLAVTVSWFGVRLVLYAAVPDRSKPLSVADLKNASPRANGPSPAGGTTRSPTPSPSRAAPEASNAGEVSKQSWNDEQGRVNYLSTVETVGGWAKVQWNSDDVAVLDTYPQTGYNTVVKRTSATRVQISFTSPGKSTAIIAWWDDGKPQLEVDNGTR